MRTFQQVPQDVTNTSTTPSKKPLTLTPSPLQHQSDSAHVNRSLVPSHQCKRNFPKEPPRLQREREAPLRLHTSALGKAEHQVTLQSKPLAEPSMLPPEPPNSHPHPTRPRPVHPKPATPRPQPRSPKPKPFKSKRPPPSQPSRSPNKPTPSSAPPAILPSSASSRSA